jgi:hypothetical protein
MRKLTRAHATSLVVAIALALAVNAQGPNHNGTPHIGPASVSSANNSLAIAAAHRTESVRTPAAQPRPFAAVTARSTAVAAQRPALDSALVAVPTATTAATTTYAAVFRGDATGRTDVTASLRSFLQSHNGQRVALKAYGVYKVRQLTFTARNLVVDFRGARIQGSQVGAIGILKIRSSSHVVLNNPRVYGTGYHWGSTTQWEHGIDVSGGSYITLNRPVTRNTRGDGIFVGYEAGRNTPPTAVLIDHPNIERASRNGIAPVGGQVTIRGGHIYYAGLHGIDIEPNDATEAGSSRVVVDGVNIRKVGNLRASTGLPGYAVSAGWGYLGTTKPSILIQNSYGDRFNIVVMKTGSVRIVNNKSDLATTAELITSSNVSYSGNVRIYRR